MRYIVNPKKPFIKYDAPIPTNNAIKPSLKYTTRSIDKNSSPLEVICIRASKPKRLFAVKTATKIVFNAKINCGIVTI